MLGLGDIVIPGARRAARRSTARRSTARGSPSPSLLSLSLFSHTHTLTCTRPSTLLAGIFVSLLLRYDAARNPGGAQVQFHTNLLAYTLGLCATVGVMHFFDAAQPALLYLVPACIGTSAAVAAARGEFTELMNFSVEKSEKEKEKEGKKD